MTAFSQYRLYYNSDGTPKFYSMEEHDIPFIEVDLQTFENGRYDIVVVNGKIKSLADNVISRLVPVSEPTATTKSCDPTDVTIIVEKSQQHILWDYAMLL
jgi:hypothetical protein